MTRGAMNQDDAEALAASLKLLANANRLSILALLAQGQRTVAEIELSTGIRQPTLSQQLGVLREAGLIQAERSAKTVAYRLLQGEIAARLRRLADVLEPAGMEGPDEPRRAAAAQAAVFASVDGS